MNFLSLSAILITCLTRISIAKRINSFIPDYCIPLKHSHNVNKIHLSQSGNDSVLVISAYLHQGLELTKDFECYVIVQAPIDYGIVTTVKKGSFHDNDTLVFQSGSNPDKVWLQKEGEHKYKEIISVPVKGEESNIFLKFKPNTEVADHMAGFEIAFTAFKPKAETTQSCGDDFFDCENDRCIWPEFQCDGYNNCGNEKDESGCAGVSVWIIILLIAIGILVVILAIFVWYRMAQR